MLIGTGNTDSWVHSFIQQIFECLLSANHCWYLLLIFIYSLLFFIFCFIFFNKIFFSENFLLIVIVRWTCWLFFVKLLFHASSLLYQCVFYLAAKSIFVNWVEYFSDQGWSGYPVIKRMVDFSSCTLLKNQCIFWDESDPFMHGNSLWLFYKLLKNRCFKSRKKCVVG